MNSLQDLSVAIVSHEATTGPPTDLRDYLIPKVRHLLYIAHPLLFIPSTRKNKSYCEEYINGNNTKITEAVSIRLPEFCAYIKDSLYTFWKIFSQPKKIDLFVGAGNINAFTGLILKKMGKVRRVVFYCIDYVPVRFKNRLMNSFYHWIDRLCYRFCDATWNLSERMIEVRKSKGLSREVNHCIVPHGVHFKRMRRLPLDQIHKKELIYMGSLLKDKGIQYVITALPLIAQEIPEITFKIVGTGPYSEELQKLVISLGLEEKVDFLGYIKDHQEVESILSYAALAVALYSESDNKFSYYADPGKIKNYLAVGLPVLITDVPSIAKEIEKAGCGKIVNLDRHQIANLVIQILKSQKTYQNYRDCAVRFASKYEWSNIFDQAFENIKQLF